MERSGVLRWLFIGGAALLFFVFGPKLFGDGESKRQAIAADSHIAPEKRAKEAVCDLWHPTFRAQISSRSATVKHFELLSGKYQKGGQAIDLSTTPDHEQYRQLFFHWRNPAQKKDWQVAYDSVDYRIEGASAESCSLVYEDDKVRLRRSFKTTGRAYELEVVGTIENLSKEKLSHALSVYTTAWRRNEEVESKMFRVSPFITHVECGVEGEATRLMPPEFEADERKEAPFNANPLNTGDWYQVSGAPEYAAVSNAYFSHAIVPVKQAGGGPVCQLQIAQRWDATRFGDPAADPNGGAIYRARLAYPERTLAPGEQARYSVLTYVGPKERNVLTEAGGGDHDLSELIDLGFFSAIAKVLTAFLLAVHGFIPNWGIAIILLTVTARLLLFPLSVPSIKSMIKMRELKPEMDALTEKFKDDPQGRGLAQMELWRKHNVNPLKGCLPQLASMPVWFALYTTLQTAVELYNIPFLWFPDLSLPDPYFVLPFIIGATSFVQQKIMPMQQGDPTQQKMMLYFLPAMFTVFMLFLPAGLGVYMFTNSLLGILQQQVVEWHVRRTGGQPSGGGGSSDTAKGKRKDRSDSSTKLPERRPLLGKGKA